MECTKDCKHADNIEKVGGVLTPLIIESLGLWTSTARKTLSEIAVRTTIHNGLTVPRAKHNLFQQLSTKLWAFKALHMGKAFRTFLARFPLCLSR